MNRVSLNCPGIKSLAINCLAMNRPGAVYLILCYVVSDLLLPPEVALRDGLGKGGTDDKLDVVTESGAHSERAFANSHHNVGSVMRLNDVK